MSLEREVCKIARMKSDEELGEDDLQMVDKFTRRFAPRIVIPGYELQVLFKEACAIFLDVINCFLISSSLYSTSVVAQWR